MITFLNLSLSRWFGEWQPPSRSVVQDLFEASDVDESGGIDREEFEIIVKVSCAQIFGRMMINYATLLLVIPFVSKLIVEKYLDPDNSYLEMICIQFTGMLLFVVVVPMLWKIIDRGAYMEAGRQASRQRSARNLHGDPDSPNSHHQEVDTTQQQSFVVPDKKTD